MTSVAHAAVNFVRNLFADRVLITLEYLGDDCIGSAHVRLKDRFHASNSLEDLCLRGGGNIRMQSYVWSGPVALDDS